MQQQSQQVSEEVLRMIERKRQEAIGRQKRKREERMAAMTNVNKVLVTSAPITKPTSIANVSVLSSSSLSSSVQSGGCGGGGIAYPATLSGSKYFQRPPVTSVATSSNAAYKPPLQINNNNFTQLRDPPQNGATPSANVASLWTKTANAAAKQKSKEPSVFKSTSPTGGVCDPEVAERKQVEISLSLESNYRFSVSMQFNSEVNKIFGNINSKTWDPKTKKWSFLLYDMENLMAKLRELKHLHINFTHTIPKELIGALVTAKERSKVVVNLADRLEQMFIDRLFPFQRDGIIFGIQREGRCLIADDMGLGKTVQAIGLAKWYRDDWPLLIVCPSSLCFQWQECIKQWIEDISVNEIHVVAKLNETIPKVAVTIVSYTLLSSLKAKCNHYGMLIMDESHYIKSDDSQRTTASINIARACKRIVLLSGTPVLSRPMGKHITCRII